MRVPGANSRKTMRSDRMRAMSVAITEGAMNSVTAGGGSRRATLAVDIAAIGNDGLAGHVRGRVGDKKHRHLCYLLCRSPTAQRNAGEPAVARLPFLRRLQR